MTGESFQEQVAKIRRENPPEYWRLLIGFTATSAKACHRLVMSNKREPYRAIEIADRILWVCEKLRQEEQTESAAPEQIKELLYIGADLFAANYDYVKVAECHGELEAHMLLWDAKVVRRLDIQPFYERLAHPVIYTRE